MSRILLQLLPYGVVGAMLALLVSCAGVSSSARLEQANDPLTSGGNLAMTAFRATAVSAVRQPVTTTRLGLAVLWHRPREIVSGNLPRTLVSQPALDQAPGTPEFEHMLDHKRFPRNESGSLKWLVDGPGFFPELDREIAAATESIDVQVFIYDNDDIAVRYADTLKRRSADVPVRVMFDDLGSTFAHRAAPETLGPKGFIPPAQIHTYLRSGSHVRVRRTLNPWMVCDHTKLLVFDKHTAFLGGMNIGREYYSEWHDLMVRIEGPVVRKLSREFNRAWKKAGPWGDLALFRKPLVFDRPKSIPDSIPLRVLRTDAAEGRYDILDSTLLAIRGARKRIWIQTPYFAHDDITVATADAARRGVDVRVIIPGRGDSTIMDAGNMVSATTLIEAGAKVYQYPKMTHMKVMLCDNWGSMGSANLDTLSMRINRELNLAFSDGSTITDLERQVFLPDFRESKKLGLSETQSAASSLVKLITDQL